MLWRKQHSETSVRHCLTSVLFALRGRRGEMSDDSYRMAGRSGPYEFNESSDHNLVF